MTASEIAAWIGAVAGVAGLGWNIYTKTREGPTLCVTAYADMVQRPAPAGDPKFLNITVQNVGTANTTLRNCSFFLRPTRWQRFLRASHLKKRPGETLAVLNHYRGEPLPQAKPLSPGSEWQALMEQDNTFTEWLDTDELHCAIWHTFSKKPVTAKIIRQIRPAKPY